MKSKTSFCNLAPLKKDIFRFAPAWGLYFIGGILVMLSLLNASSPYFNVDSLGESLPIFSIINLIYALLCAQLLFGDLFNSRLCGALHAMPLRRENWFLCHVAAGICFSLVPTGLGALVIMPRLEEYWYAALLWLAGMELQYLFFFSVAVLSCMCTGNRFAAVVVYGIVNFGAEMLLWFASTLYQPQLYGVIFDNSAFHLFSPTVYILSDGKYFEVQYVENTRRFLLLGGWGYLGILAGVGVAFLALALVLYRRRALEKAGDFIAFRPLAPVFLVIYTMCAGTVFALLGDLIVGSYLAFLIVGIAVGYFTGQMLLKRTIKVFTKRTLAGFVIFAVVIAGSIGITGLDPLGIVRWKPQAQDVETVSVQFLNGDPYYDRYYNVSTVFTDPQQIQRVLLLHDDLVARGDADAVSYEQRVELRYTLKNGRTVARKYIFGVEEPKFVEQLASLFSQPEVVFDYSGVFRDWEHFLSKIRRVQIGEATLSQAEWMSLMEAVKADCDEGHMGQEYFLHPNADKVIYNLEVELRPTQPLDATRYLQLGIWSDCVHTIEWIKENLPDLVIEYYG